MDWDDDVSGAELVDERLADVSTDDIVASLPDGAPGASAAGKGRKLTEADKKLVQRLRELAFREARKHNDLYSHVLLLDILEAVEKGRGSEYIFKYIAVHGHPAGEQYKWCRILPQHRVSEGKKKGKKYEVYRLVDVTEEIASPPCGCSLCLSYPV